jgi:pimeloyl-ACP methyl ester carboxylesterase
VRVAEHTIELAGSPVFLRRAPAPDPAPLYLHGAGTSSDDWTLLLERTGGIAVDLPGFGRTGKGGHLDLSPAGQATFLGELLDHLEIPQVSLVAHDWGAAAALGLTAARPEAVAGIVLVNPLGPGSDPRRLARLLRVPLIGELTVGSISRPMLARGIRRASTEAAWPDERVAIVWEQFDQGTQRAVLRLARAPAGVPVPPPGIPTTLVFGAEDPWSASGWWTARLPSAERHELPGTRHWPWLESPEAADRIVASLRP